MKSPRTLPLLVEIGCEEIPARFLRDAEAQLGSRLRSTLNHPDIRLLPPGGRPIAYSTPRRLVALARVLERGRDREEKITGPPASVAFDAQGKPTKAAEGFARTHGVSLRELSREPTERGEYVAIRRTLRGRAASRVLPEVLRSVLQEMDFPKSMYWERKAGPRFTRPIRWLLALLGEGKRAQVVPFEIAGVNSGDRTYGHRALGKRAIRVRSFAEYSKLLRRAQVEFDSERRRQKINTEIGALLEGSGLNVLEDKDLEDWIVNSTEWPRALIGTFDERYLGLPREILVTVMRDHQKYFAVTDQNGDLKPRFIAVFNLSSDSRGLIRAGHERVLAARFTDAEFFWNADQRLSLEKRVELLGGVTYQAQLGSYAEKLRRMEIVAAEIYSQLEAQKRAGAAEWRPLESERVRRAVKLCKCDLTTQMVREFPELQGVVGGLYARAQGEQAEVPDAIYDHYLPQGLEDKCPRSAVGAVASLADKIDSVAAGFALGHGPTGSSDPFALRRQANGVVKVLLELSLALPLTPVLKQALNALNIRWRRPQAEVFSSLVNFMVERLRYYLETVRKLRYDTVRAVLAAGWDPPLGALRRAEGLEALRGREDLEALSIAAKRIRNILSKSASASDWQPGDVDTSLLQEGPEGGLYTAFAVEREKIARLVEEGAYRQALEAIATLRPYVDRFFDKVLVMAEDRALRQNRLRLLGKLDELFSGIAHFAEIASHVDASTSKVGLADN